MNASEVSEDIVYYFFKVTHIYIDDLNVARETTILAQITLVNALECKTGQVGTYEGDRGISGSTEVVFQPEIQFQESFPRPRINFN